MSERGITRILVALQASWFSFFYRRCLIGFPWFSPARPPCLPAMVAARRLVRRHFGSDHHRFARVLAQVLAAMVWPVAVLVHLLEIRYFRGARAVPIKHAPGALWAAIRHNVIPGEYYAYALWKPNRKKNIDNYLYSREASRLFKLLNRPSQPNPIDDKLAFFEMCRVNALPTPEILAAFTPSGMLLEFASGLPPERDLFVKPRIGVASVGNERLRWQRIIFESDLCGPIRPEQLVGYLATRARTEKRTLLVQPALSNHPELLIAASDTLAVVRLVTGISAEGDITPIFGHIHFFVGTAIHSVALIDLASGRFQSTQRKFYGARWSTHQQTDLDGGDMLPEWHTALRYTELAHKICSNFVFIGWDVAFTQHGPMLLEGNVNWTASDYQRLCGEPLGHTKFSHVLATQLNNLCY